MNRNEIDCRIAVVWCLIVLLVSLGCQRRSRENVLRLAVTTSTRDSGLLEVLLPRFEEKHSARVDVLAVGTGAALKLGEAGDVDALICHAQDRELQFLAAGHAVRREPLMSNHFVLLGPQSDPAAIQGLAPLDAFSKLFSSEVAFVSRADESGTHLREQTLLDLAGAGSTSGKSNMMETGQGMGASLVIANEKRAYILSDRGTYLNFKAKIDLVPLVDSGKQLENPYGVLVVNPNKNTSINSDLAHRLADYLTSDEVQRLIAEYEVSGEALFFAASKSAQAQVAPAE